MSIVIPLRGRKPQCGSTIVDETVETLSKRSPIWFQPFASVANPTRQKVSPVLSFHLTFVKSKL